MKVEQIIHDYIVKRVSMPVLASRYSLTLEQVRKVLVSNNVTIRPRGKQPASPICKLVK